MVFNGDSYQWMLAIDVHPGSNSRNKDCRSRSACLLDRILHRSEDWLVQVLLTGLLGICASDDFGA